MTNQRVPDLSPTDALGSDPLADDYGAASPPPAAASAIPPAPPAYPPAYPPAAPSPDPGADRFSAFDEPPVQSPRAPRASQPVPPSQPVQPAGRGASPSPTVTGVRRRTPRVARGLLIAVGAAVLLPVVAGVGFTTFLTDKKTADSAATPADRSLVAAEVTVSPTPVPQVPATVATLRIEFQGPGRTADVRVYTPDGTRNVDNRALPYAVDLPVEPGDAYVAASADDYGYRGSQPMRCTISVGDTVLATAVGTKSVDCKVTDDTWRRDR